MDGDGQVGLGKGEHKGIEHDMVKGKAIYQRNLPSQSPSAPGFGRNNPADGNLPRIPTSEPYL